MPAKIAPYLAEVLRRERAGKGWSMIEFARRAGIDRSHLGEIEAEKRSPTVETLERLCEPLGFELSALFLEAERRRDLEQGRSLGTELTP